jgi:ABC-2 type transport system ATP-binding protein
MAATLVTKSLRKEYPSKVALRDMDITLGGDGIVGLIGRNGAGKTTLLKILAGYIRPTSGDVRIFSAPVFDNLNVLSRLVFIDEEMQFDRNFRLRDILRVCQIHYANWDAGFAQRLLAFFKLDTRKAYRQLSRGMKTQFNIIVGLAARAPVTLLDEPTLGLDAAVRKEFYDIMLSDYLENPRTIIISSHLLGEMENLLGEIILLDEGRLVMHQPMDVFQDYGVYLEGSKAAVLPHVEKHTVWRREELGQNVMVAVRNDFDASERALLASNPNVRVSRIPVQDLCIYLTGQGKDVSFNAFSGN